MTSSKSRDKSQKKKTGVKTTDEEGLPPTVSASPKFADEAHIERGEQIVEQAVAELSLIDSLKLKIKEFPTTSGVYLMKNKAEKIIYVGKAKNVKSRVRSYFTDSKDLTPKTRVLVSYIQDIEFILTKTEVEAFLLEASLIKKHRPKYNIRLKDDKSYPYIKLSWGDKFPRLYLARKVHKDGSLYFGPYTKGYVVWETIRFLNRTFKIRDCSDSVFKSRARPCMTHQIGRCTAPCVDLISPEDYKSEVEGAKDFLRGKGKKILKDLKDKMETAAEAERFEAAAKFRDSIGAIKSIFQKQAMINDSSDADQDAVGFFGNSQGCLVETVHVRGGLVIGTRSHYFPLLDPTDPSEDPREWLVSFLNQYYEDNIIPDEILVSVELGREIRELFQAVLKERSGRDVTIRFPTDEKSTALIDMAHKNAESHFNKYVTTNEEKKRGLEEIQAKLGLSTLPQRIECFDISTFQGSETVASQVVFEDGVPAKDSYRRYKIKTVEGVNDYASMHEVLSRRFAHKEFEDPQLIVIDGGKGQLSVAVKVLQEIGRDDLPVVGLAKARTLGSFEDADVTGTEERFFIPGRQNPVVFKPATDAYQILVGIRDEAHRFAITYHRKLRESTSLESELDFVVGLGEKRKRDLLKKFDSVESLKAASVAEISEIKGFNRVLAERILLQLNETEEGDAGAEG